MLTLGTVGLGSYLAMGGSKKKEQGPAFNATSKDEEKFIKCVLTPVREHGTNHAADGHLRSDFMKNAEADANKTKH